MDNFNLQGYMASGKLHATSKTLTEAKKQGYDDELDDSLGAKNGKKKQDMKQRRADSENMEKAKGKRKYSGDKSKDKVDEKQGYDDREDESLGARKGAEKGKKQSMKDRRDDSYGKFGKRDAEKKGKNKINKENLAEKEDSKKGNESEQKRMEGAIKDDRDHIKGLKKDIEDNERKLARLKKDYKKDVIKEEEEFVGTDINANSLLDILAEYLPTNHYHQDKTLSYDEALEMVTEFVKFVGMDSTGEDFLMHIADTEGSIKEGYGKPMYDEDDTDAKNEEMSTKMKVSDLKKKIKEQILSELTLDEAEEDVDVDIDVEDEVEVEAGADDIEIERPGVKTTVSVGLSPEEEVVQDSLKAAMDAASQLGNDKLADQIGNTITFFTREYVVGNRDD